MALAGAPEVRLLDARALGLDESGLREWARAETSASGARYGARSYEYPYGLVAWHSEPVGVDLERIARCDPDLIDSISTPSERPLHTDQVAYATSLWCSKEALAKALGDALRYDPRRLDSPLHWPAGEAGPWRARELAAPADHTAWLCWRQGLPRSAVRAASTSG